MAIIPEETLDRIKKYIGNEFVLLNEPMKDHTNMEVGGPAEYMFLPGNTEELAFVIKELKGCGCPYYIIGKGSNLIFRDEGYRGAVIKVLERFKGIKIEGTKVFVSAGETNKDISEALADAGLSGFEFASGIPGCIGGGITMNAGAYEGEMKDIVEDVTVLTGDGEVKTIPADQMGFGYRTSIIPESGCIVLGATLRLKEEKSEVIRNKINELTEKRESKQPLEYPSCGSVFKRPAGYFAGGLISQAGLKGKQIGGAQVSEKHAGFIVNKGGATASDVIALIEYVQEKVYEDSGVELKCEVKII